MEPDNKDSKACLVCVLVLLPLLALVLFFTGIFPSVNFSEEGWAAIPKAVGYLGVIALLIERFIEVILSPCRAPESKELKQKAQAARDKAASLATAAENAKSAAEDDARIQEAKLANYTSITQRWALFIGFAVALAVSSSGVRLLQPLFDTTELDNQARAFRRADLDVAQAEREEKRKRTAFEASWSATQAGLTRTNLHLVLSNRVSEMTGQAMGEFSPKLFPAGALSNAALARMAWETASTNTTNVAAGRDALLEQQSRHRQLWWLRLIDVLLTAAALTGGTQPLHELLAWWSQANEKRKKTP